MTNVDMNHHLNQSYLRGQAARVKTMDLCLSDGTPVPFRKAIVNEETGVPVSVVGSGYNVVQHNEILSALDTAADKLGDKVPRGVSFARRGAVMRALFKFPHLEQDDPIRGKLCPVIRITNSYDGTTSLHIEIGAFRFVCTNMAIGGGGFHFFKIRAIHTSDIDIIEIEKGFSSALGAFPGVVKRFQELSETSASPELMKKLTRALEPVNRRMLGHVLDGYQAGISSAYNVYNRCTDYATHRSRSMAGGFRLLAITNDLFFRQGEQETQDQVDLAA